VGKVGSNLVGRLVDEGARVTIADVDPSAIERVRRARDVAVVPVEEAHRTPCDIYSPCALGGVLDARTIPELRCWGIAGAANNQLADASCASLLADAGVLYVPDFVANAGGIINIAEERAPGGYDRERAYPKVTRVHETALAVFDLAKEEGVTTAEAAVRLARRRLDAAAGVHQIRTFP
jgi:glutamate dehydrogenase/leucine dehydrogenase